MQKQVMHKIFLTYCRKTWRIVYNIDVNIYEIPTKNIREAVTKMFISHTFIFSENFSNVFCNDSRKKN